MSRKDKKFDVGLLHDKVHRLSYRLDLNRHLLRKEQGNISDDDMDRKEQENISDEDMDHCGQSVPRLNQRLLTSLLLEYDQIIEDMTQEINTYKVESEAMALRVEQVTEENVHLHSEFRKMLEGQINAATQGAGVGGVVDSLQEDLKLVSKERDSFQSMLNKTLQELQILQKSEQNKDLKLIECKTDLLEAQKAAPLAMKHMEKLQSSCTKLTEEQDKCVKAMKSQEAELSSLQNLARQLKAELREAHLKNEELKDSLGDKLFQLKKREAEQMRLRSTENALDENLHAIACVDLKGRYHVAQREIMTLTSEKDYLEETLAMLQAQISAMQKREFEITRHVKDSIEVAETAVMEKDQVVFREQQLATEVERLQSTLDLIVKEAGEMTKTEINLARKEYNYSIDKMGLEIRRLEQECGKCQAQFDRCEREKKAVEKELEKAYAIKPVEIRQTGENMYDLQKRACLAERVRDDTVIKLEAQSAQVMRLELCLSEEKEVNKQIIEDHRKWQRAVEEESQQLREQRMKAIARADELQQRLRVSDQSRKDAELRLTKEVASLKQRQIVKEKEMAYRLESAEEAHYKSIQELRDLLTAQYKFGAKWKVESKTLAQNYERVTSDLNVELMRHKMRSNELTKQLKHLKSVKEELSKKHNEATKSNINLKHRLKETEGQVSELLGREKNLMHTRKELNRQVDALKLQVRKSSARPQNMQGFTHHSHYGQLPTRHTTTAINKHLPHHKTLDSVVLDTTLPSHHSLYLSAPPAQEEEWDQTLKDLKHSIHQVRKDLKQNTQENPYKKMNKSQEEEENASDYSTFSKGDLSHSTSAIS